MTIEDLITIYEKKKKRFGKEALLSFDEATK